MGAAGDMQEASDQPIKKDVDEREGTQKPNSPKASLEPHGGGPAGRRELLAFNVIILSVLRRHHSLTPHSPLKPPLPSRK